MKERIQPIFVHKYEMIKYDEIYIMKLSLFIPHKS